MSSPDALDLQLAVLMSRTIQECEITAAQAKAFGPAWVVTCSEEAIATIRKHLGNASTASLPRPSQGASLGFSRALGEWADNYKPVMTCAYAVDSFYKWDCDCPREG